MRSLFISFAAAIVLLLSGPFASAQQSIVETVATGCESELNTYCDGVTPGEARILSCLEAQGTNIQKRCTQALEDVGLK